MPAKPRYMQTTPAQRTVSLDASTLSYLDQIAPDNISEALRYCVQFAMQYPEALFRATVQHTAAQCRKHQQRYPDNAAPLPTTYGGHVMTARPAPAPAQVITPAPIQTAETIYMDRKAAEWIEANEPRILGELVNKRAAQVTAPAPVIINGVTQGTEEEYLMYADDDDDEPAQVAPPRVEPLEPIVIRGQPLSAAALAAVAAIALTDDEIRALDPARGGAQPFVG